MKKKILITALAFGLTTALMADMAHGEQKDKMVSGKTCADKSNCNDKKDDHDLTKNCCMGMFSIFQKANLTQKQKEDVDAIIASFKTKMELFEIDNDKKPLQIAYTKDGFDKSKFLEATKERHSKKIELKVEALEKIDKILTKEQKELIFSKLNSTKTPCKH